MDTAETLIGTSGHLAVHLIQDGTGDPGFMIEHQQLGEVIDLPDLATAREVHALLSRAIMLAEIRLIINARIQALFDARRLPGT